MTPAQKKARENFKKAIAEAKKIRKKNPKLSHTQAVKQAWAILKKSKKVGAIKIIEKGETKKAKPKATYQVKRTAKGTYKGLKKVGGVKKLTHKDTKSHNVNIRVMSGINEAKQIVKEIERYENTILRMTQNIKQMKKNPNKNLSFYKLQIQNNENLLKKYKEALKDAKKNLKNFIK